MRSKVLERLPQANSAAFYSYDNEYEPLCHPATRTSLLRDIQSWVDHPNGKYIFWLKGMAGTGKSTISRTVAKTLARKQLLGASFFFKRGEEHRSNALRFFTTISAQLADKIPEIIPHIVKALDADPKLSNKTIKEQFEKLVLKPLSGIKATQSLNCKKFVILIDALDECEDERQIATILRLLPTAKILKSVSLRIFLTSRPDLPIRLGFQEMDVDTHQDVALHDIPEYIIDHDLRAFLKDEFSQIKKRHLPQSDWPTDNNLEALVQMARPLFIYAVTVCRFVSDRRLGKPQELLESVLQYKAISQVSKLSGTYLPVLRPLLAGLDRSVQEQVIKRFRHTVGTIITLIDPLSKEAIASLLSVSTSYLDCTLDFLHSVLSVPSDVKLPIRLLHLSFHDFLLDKKQCDPDFWVDEKQANETLAARCIQLMSTSLKEDICGVTIPGTLVADIESCRVEQYLPLEVQYACLYWIQHLQRSNAPLQDNDHVHQFLQKHLLHWLEALSWMQKMSEGILEIISLESIISVSLLII
jgi:NACHT domain